MAPLRILVTGANGRLGRLLQAAWMGQADVQPIWQARQPLAGYACFDPLADPDGFARAAEGCDAIVNLAGVTRPTAETAGVNAALALAALQAGQAAGVGRVFLMSSAAVYGADPGDRAEDAAPHPQSLYGQSKLQMEEAARRRVAQTGQAATCLRLGNVAGADQLLGNAGGGGPVLLDQFADGAGPVRSYIGPVSLARVLVQLVRTAELPWVLNIATAPPVAMADLLQAAGCDWAYRPAPPQAIARVGLDVTRLQGVHRFAPEEASAAEMVAQWRRCEGRVR